MRVMIRMRDDDVGRVGELDADVAIGEPSGPIENGTTYIVRPFMQPSNSPLSVARISAGSRQLLVGPASSSSSEQMKVRSSTRATSLGSEQREVGVRALGVGELLERAGVDERLAEAVVLLRASRRTSGSQRAW